MIQGILFFDAESGRYNFYYDNEQGEQCDYEGIHCGECFEVKLNGVWVPTRVEMGCDREWYLAGLPSEAGWGGGETEKSRASNHSEKMGQATVFRNCILNIKIKLWYTIFEKLWFPQKFGGYYGN